MAKKRFSALAWGVLGYGLVVILWGYFLRISESGDGCGTDWPLCEGALVPAGAEFPTWVEFAHRVSSGLALVLVFVLARCAVQTFGKGHPVRQSAIASLAFTITESLFGALLVVFGWVAGDISVGRILIRPLHVTNTFLLMAALGLTAWWASRNVERIGSLKGSDTDRFWLAGAGLLALAATGSWTGLAGTAFPADTLQSGLGQYIDPEHMLIYLRTVHPIVAVVAIVLLVRATRTSRHWPGGTTQRRLTRTVWILAAAQPLIGALTVVLLHPVALRLFHLILADLLWLATLFLWSTQLETGAGKSERGEATAGA